MTAGWHQTSAKSLWQITLHLKALAFQTVSQELNMFNVHQKKSNWVSAGLRQKATSTSWSVGIDWKVIEDIQENKLCWIDKWTVSRGSSKFQVLSGWHGFRSTYAKLTNIYSKSAEVFWCNPVSNDGVSSVSKF